MHKFPRLLAMAALSFAAVLQAQEAVRPMAADVMVIDHADRLSPT